jgi:hypothetical protein
MKESQFNSQQKEEIFLFSKMSTPTHPLLKGCRNIFPKRVSGGGGATVQ